MGTARPTVEGYEVSELVGRSVHALVYRARQMATDREVALKVLDSYQPDADTIAAFIRECKAVQSLSWHRHAVAIFGAGTTTTGSLYVATEFFPYGSLADTLEAGDPLTVDGALRAAADIASALAAAHDLKLLHRNIKPGNVLIDRTGRARLGDFGMNRFEGLGVTIFGQVCAVNNGIAYRAPEDLRGAKDTPAGDVYSLGVTLLTLVNGRHPFSADCDDPFAVCDRIRSGAPLDIPAILPHEAQDLIRATTTHDPAERPSVPNVAAALSRLAPSVPVTSSPSTRPGIVGGS